MGSLILLCVLGGFVCLSAILVEAACGLMTFFIGLFSGEAGKAAQDAHDFWFKRPELPDKEKKGNPVWDFFTKREVK